MDSLLKAKESIEKNSSSLITSLIIAVLLVGGYLGYRHVRKQALDSAQNAFGKAMIAYQANPQEAISEFTKVIDAHGNTPQAAYSALMLGDIYMSLKNYDEAIQWLETAASKGGKAGFVSGQAHEALGVCYEAKGEYNKALSEFTAALTDQDVAYRHPAIRWKIALINKQIGKLEASRSQCESLVADTAAGEYTQKAKNLLAELTVM